MSAEEFQSVDENLRSLLLEMAYRHEESGKCGPDCFCQELLDELDPKRIEHFNRLGTRKNPES